jgi:DNA-binding NarL/FixJ family response regulator
MFQPRILIVEDHPLMADALRVHLQSIWPQVQCVQAANLQDSLVCLQAQAFMLVLLDLNLPDSEGLQTLSVFCNHCTQSALAVLTAVEDENIAQACLANNVVYLRKSMQTSQLMADLLKLLNQMLHVPPIPTTSLSAQQPAPHPMANLSNMQRLVLAHLAQGKTSLSIAQELHVTEATVRSHMTQIYKRLAVKNRTQACSFYLRWTQQQGLFDV